MIFSTPKIVAIGVEPTGPLAEPVFTAILAAPNTASNSLADPERQLRTSPT